MSVTANKDLIVRLWYQELWDKWNISTADQLLTDDYQLHASGVPVALNREATKKIVMMFNGAFPDLTHTVDEMLGEGETIAARWTVRGTHRGEFQGIPATGKSIVLSGLTVHHLRDGKLCETWLSFDQMALMQQLGTISVAAA